jgi:DNA-directed RNA polymerase specialized sigma24 family protein
MQVTVPNGSRGSALAEFEQIYRGNVGAVTGYFARRCADAQTVADLTSETIVRAAGAFGGFDPRRGTARAWLFGIAAKVYARHCAQSANGRDAAVRLAGLGDLSVDEIDELTDRIDAQRAGRELIALRTTAGTRTGRGRAGRPRRLITQGGRGGAGRRARGAAHAALSRARTTKKGAPHR